MNVVCVQCWAIDNCIIEWKQFQIDLNSPKPIYDSVYAIESLIKLLIVILEQWIHLDFYLKKKHCYYSSVGWGKCMIYVGLNTQNDRDFCNLKFFNLLHTKFSIDCLKLGGLWYIKWYCFCCWYTIYNIKIFIINIHKYVMA